MKKISLEIRKGKNGYIVDTFLCQMEKPYEKMSCVYSYKRKGDTGPRVKSAFPDIILTEQLTTWYD